MESLLRVPFAVSRLPNPYADSFSIEALIDCWASSRQAVEGWVFFKLSKSEVLC
jgi:hypothetical protein